MINLKNILIESLKENTAYILSSHFINLLYMLLTYVVLIQFVSDITILSLLYIVLLFIMLVTNYTLIKKNKNMLQYVESMKK